MHPAWGCALKLQVVATLLVATLIFTPGAHANEDLRKEVLRLQATEFCAVFKPPPAGWVQAVIAGAEAGDIQARILANWIMPIIAHYKKAGCGDA